MKEGYLQSTSPSEFSNFNEATGPGPGVQQQQLPWLLLDLAVLPRTIMFISWSAGLQPHLNDYSDKSTSLESNQTIPGFPGIKLKLSQCLIIDIKIQIKWMSNTFEEVHKMVFLNSF